MVNHGSVFEGVENALKRVRDCVRCSVCERVPERPLFFPQCGHSSDCETCLRITKPKKCPICDMPNKTPVGRMVRNKTLDATLRALFPADFEGRPDTTELAVDIECKRDTQTLKRKAEALKMSEEYLGNATKVIRTHYYGQGTKRTHLIVWCEYGLVCIPKHKRGNENKWFLSCPMWTPTSVARPQKRKRETDGNDDNASEEETEDEYVRYHCRKFAWMSAKQRELWQKGD